MSLTRSSNDYTFGMSPEKSRSLSYQQNVKAVLNEILSGAETQTLQAVKAVQSLMGFVVVSTTLSACQFSLFQVLSVLQIVSNAWTPVATTI